MKRPKTKKQKAFFKNIANGDTKHQAAKKAGYKCPGSSAKETIEKYQDYWNDLLNKANATDEFIAQTIYEGLKATKVVGYLQSVNKDQDGQMHKVKADMCVSNEFVEVADYPTRAKFVDIALRLKNAYPAAKMPTDNEGKPLPIMNFYIPERKE